MKNQQTNQQEKDNFEALVKAIKESQNPVSELADLLKQQFTPVKQQKLRTLSLTKVCFEDNRCFELEPNYRYDDGLVNLIVSYKILNEIHSTADCVQLSKNMLYESTEDDGRYGRYNLKNVAVAQDELIVTFERNIDEVLI